MFDVGFSELIVIGIVALIVIGPERLPKVARTIGLLLGRAQRYVNDVKADINREMHLDELKRLQAEVAESARSLEDSVRQEVSSTKAAVETPVHEAATELAATAQSLENSVRETAAPASSPATPTAETPERPAS